MLLISIVGLTVNANNISGRIEIESPTNGGKVKKTLNYQGWTMSEDINSTVEVYVDGVKQGNISRYGREDVLNAIKEYGGRATNPTPGYSGSVDLSGLQDGNHTLTVRIVSQTGVIIKEKTTKFYLQKYDCKAYLESPKLNHFNSTINIKGWEMSEMDNSYIKVYIDDKDMNVNFNRMERQDVIDAIKNYGGQDMNLTPGFNGKIDISSISNGKHTMSIKIYSKFNEVIYSYKNNICIKACLPTYYNQADQRWADVVFGLSSMQKTGCAPTSMAMAFSTILSKNILPTDVANYLYYQTDQFNRNMKGTSGLGIIYASNYYGIKYTPLSSKQELANVLSSGRIVYVAMGNGRFATPFYNHAIVLHSYSNGNTMAYDPLKLENNTYVSIDQLWSEQSKDYDDYRGGSNFYSLEGYF